MKTSMEIAVKPLSDSEFIISAFALFFLELQSCRVTWALTAVSVAKEIEADIVSLRTSSKKREHRRYHLPNFRKPLHAPLKDKILTELRNRLPE
ncbi:hypothetical protein PR048_005327 [Dryococelus australis]|uniref:Uncharacterized protein n=1 Tax=Dryococelus australis TaxID=614101 RepID=A0ABQ9I8S9_9NEOP|nr:hypothetical protein PR048_005327 [Dryococelus australis]